MVKIKRIGILGGTFNPIHLGHLILAEATAGYLELEKVIFVPACLPPHKTKKDLVSARQRYRMVKLAVRSNPLFGISDLELKRAGVSYSVLTVERLRSVFTHSQLYFIVGSDFLQEFSRWKDIERIKQLCKFAIAPRPGFEIKKQYRHRLSRNMQIIGINTINISASEIRQRIKARQSIRYLVPDQVRNYILKNKLYS